MCMSGVCVVGAAVRYVHVMRCPQRTEVVRSSGARVTGCCDPPTWVLGTKLAFSARECMLSNTHLSKPRLYTPFKDNLDEQNWKGNLVQRWGRGTKCCARQSPSCCASLRDCVLLSYSLAPGPCQCSSRDPEKW